MDTEHTPPLVSLGQGPGAVHTFDGINWLPGTGLVREILKPGIVAEEGPYPPGTQDPGWTERDEPTIDDLEAIRPGLAWDAQAALINQAIDDLDKVRPDKGEAFWKAAARLARLTAVWRDDPTHLASMTTTSDDPSLVALAAAHVCIESLLQRGQRLADALQEAADVTTTYADTNHAHNMRRHVEHALHQDLEDLVKIGGKWKGAMRCKPGD